MTKKYFGTDGIRARANVFPMTAEFALRLGVAVATVLKRKKKKNSVVIGKDTRLSCYMLEYALAAGLTTAGVDVFFVGPIPTPGVAMLTRSMRCDLGIVISASHNPYYDNGIKFFDSNGIKFPDDIEKDIESIIDSENLMDNYEMDSKIGKSWRFDNFIYQQRYIEYVKSVFPKNLTLQGLKIVVDCANGAAYKIAPAVLWELGAFVVKMFYEPDGTNINDGCGSTHPEQLQKRVVKEKADLGLAFDGDADRLIMVDENGQVIDGDKIIALIAKKMYVEDKLNNNTVVITQMSNLGLEEYLNKYNIQCVRTKVGDRYVAEEMRNHGYNLGGEQSGHIILGDYSTTGDGLCCALQVLACLQKVKMEKQDFTISRLVDLYETVPQLLKNVKYEASKGDPLENEEVKKVIAKAEEKLIDKGRLLIRKSGTEPLIRVMAESRDEKLMNEVVEEIVAVITNVIKG